MIIISKYIRVKATESKLASIANPLDRMRQSVFGQLHKEMRSWSSSSYRRSYVGKGHGGQKRAFKVKFTGEGVNDYGGPYRAGMYLYVIFLFILFENYSYLYLILIKYIHYIN